MKAIHYVLNGHEVVEEPDSFAWAQWFETSWPARRVDETLVGDVRVSTVFLGIDHSFGDGAVEVFETMVFRDGDGGDDDDDDYCERYATWDEAVEGHARAVAKVTP